jgi:multisubunit Na+/H+ antiporter MnhE subunit
MRRLAIVPYLLLWASQWLLWLIFADSYGIREGIVGAVSAAASTHLVALFIARTKDHYKIQARHLMPMIHVPGKLFGDAWVLLVAIKRRLTQQKLGGGIVSVPFHAGANDGFSRARRALAVTYLTFTPNSLVLGISKDADLMSFHTVIPRPFPSFLEKLGARPEQSP